jgi:hypothetical protein
MDDRSPLRRPVTTGGRRFAGVVRRPSDRPIRDPSHRPSPNVETVPGGSDTTSLSGSSLRVPLVDETTLGETGLGGAMSWAAEPPPRPKRRARRSQSWYDEAEDPPAFNPLDLVNLGRSVELALLATQAAPLNALPKTIGAGVYALYYHGPYALYAPISSTDLRLPIYVGKAIPAGGRKGTADTNKPITALFDRLQEHRRSLDEAHGLDSADFTVRYLVVTDVFIPLAERVMIRQLRPTWNVAIDGFGNHDPGSRRRREQQRSAWDELHPGRWWAHPSLMPNPCATSVAQIRATAARHLETLPDLSPHSLAAPSVLADEDLGGPIITEAEVADDDPID